MKLTTLIIVFFAATVINAQDVTHFFKKTDAFFKTSVTNGLVDYKSIKANPEALNALLKASNAIAVSGLSETEQKAFWINLYNLTTIKSVISHYPITSPLDVNGFFDKKKHKVGGATITLNDIENKKIRAKFNDPRIHFVLVCAGLGCPPIIDSAYLPETLDMQLEKQTKKALNDPKFIQVNKKKKKVAVSEIFKWYMSDFGKNTSDIITFINSYRTEKIPNNYKLSHYAYDWKLNII